MAENLGVPHKIKYQQFYAEALPFPARSFNAIFMLNNLQHLEGEKKGLNECISILRPGGVLCAIEMNQKGIENIHRSSDFIHEVEDPRNLLKKENFSVECKEGQYANAYIFWEN